MVKIYIGDVRGKVPQGGGQKREAEHRAGIELLRRGVSALYGVEVTEERIERGPYGKPYLMDHPDIHFNISHSGRIAVCAVGRGPLGVDVEWIRSYSLGLIKRVLSEKEKKQMDIWKEENKGEAFFRFWTLKESCVKAMGCGITVPLNKIEFTLTGKDGIISGPEGWYFYQIKEGEMILSLCTDRPQDIQIERNTVFLDDPAKS